MEAEKIGRLTVEIVTLTDLHKAVGDTVNRAYYGRVPIVVTKRGNPIIILVPIIGALTAATNLHELVVEALGLEPHGEGAGEEEQVEG